MAIANQRRVADPQRVAGRYGGDTHYSSNEGLVFIGDYLLDEVVAISYKQEQRKVPFYGYASQYYDQMAAGKVIVTGSFTINYIDAGYLYLAQMEYTKKQLKTPSTQASVYQTISGVRSIDRSLVNTLSPVAGRKNAAGDASGARHFRKIAQLIATDPLSRDRVIKELRQRYWNSQSDQATNDHALTSNLRVVQGMTLEDVQRKSHNFSQRPDQMPPINLTISHGNPLDPERGTFRVIRDVDIISNEMHLSPTGQTQLETYSFMARSIG